MWWLITGLVLGIGIWALIQWLRSKSIEVKWYDWLIGIVGLMILLFAFQNFFGSFIEHETTAAWMMLLFPGLPALILLVLAWQLVWRRHRVS